MQDAKTASKAIPLRIKKIIGNLVHCDQTAYVCKRNIRESARLINDILEYTDENDKEAILFSADFGKAFDSVEHFFIIFTLRAFGFSPDFIQSVKTFFNLVLLIQIRENADIKDIIIDKTEIKLSAYAGDGSLFVTDVQSLQMIFFSCVTNSENYHL